MSALIPALTHAFGLMAICTMVFGQIQKHIASSGLRHVAIGLIMGVATAIAMTQPYLVVGGHQVDGRSIFIVIAAAFGGTVALVISAGMAVAMRLWMGGSGAYLGVVSIVIVCMLGVVWAYATRTEMRRSSFSWAVLGATLSVPLIISVLFFRIEMPGMAFLRVIPDVIFALIFGKMFEAELRRGLRERQLKAEASTDPLTGLPNRRAMMDHVGQASVRERHGMGLLIIDVDHFKAINDTYGHGAGDLVLKTISDRLSGAIRSGDMVARIGGEEFAVVLNLTRPVDGYAMADRIRLAVSGLFQIDETTKITVTVSVGGTHLTDEPFDFGKAYARADAAPYEAKHAGRDRTIFG